MVRYFIHEDAEIEPGASILSPYVQVLQKAWIQSGAVLLAGVCVGEKAHVYEGVHLGNRVKVSHEALIHEGAVLLDDVHIGEKSQVGMGSRLERRVKVGPNVSIGKSALILEGALICPNDVHSTSTNGRTLRDRVMVGRGVLLHDEVELGEDAIVPTQDTICHIGNLGRKNRVVTIYGSDKGPRISLGCNLGVSYPEIRKNILLNAGNPGTHTTEASAGSYVPYLPIFNQIGAIVQFAYDQKDRLVEEMKAMRDEYI